jgi:hypothetical protein
MKRISCGLFTILALPFMTGQATGNTISFTFEGSSAGGNIEYGTPLGLGPLVRNGFIIDVADTSMSGQHFHELDSLNNSKVPDRPIAERGVLWSDWLTGSAPLFLAPQQSMSIFLLESLVVGGSDADGSQTTAVQVSGFRNGSLLGTVDLPTSTSYVSYSGSLLGALRGLSIDRLEFVGLSTSAIGYYELDNIVLDTIAAVPEPSTLALVSIGALGSLSYRRWRRL